MITFSKGYHIQTDNFMILMRISHKTYNYYIRTRPISHHMTAQDPVALIRNGDRIYFHSLYYSLEESCRKYILKRGGDQTMVDEILHEGLYRFFVRVKEKEDFELRTSIEAVVFGFIKMVWRQKCNTDSRYKKLHKDVEEHDWLKENLMDTEKGWHDSDGDDSNMIMDLVAQLGKDCKDILLAFYVHRISLQEIADELKVSYDYAKLKRFRCIKQLRAKYFQRVA